MQASKCFLASLLYLFVLTEENKRHPHKITAACDATPGGTAPKRLRPWNLGTPGESYVFSLRMGVLALKFLRLINTRAFFTLLSLRTRYSRREIL
jgi:hypothetical protein